MHFLDVEIQSFLLQSLKVWQCQWRTANVCSQGRYHSKGSNILCSIHRIGPTPPTTKEKTNLRYIMLYDNRKKISASVWQKDCQSLKGISSHSTILIVEEVKRSVFRNLLERHLNKRKISQMLPTNFSSLGNNIMLSDFQNDPIFQRQYCKEREREGSSVELETRVK